MSEHWQTHGHPRQAPCCVDEAERYLARDRPGLDVERLERAMRKAPVINPTRAVVEMVAAEYDAAAESQQREGAGE